MRSIFTLFIFSVYLNIYSQSSICFTGSSKYSNYPLGANDKSALIKSFDINNDGNIDVLFPSGAQIGYRLGLGNGLFSSTSYISTGAQSFNDLEICDLNNDGKQDIIGHNSSLFYLKNNGNGTFSTPYLIPSPGSIAEYSFSDYNNDTYKDILCSNYNTVSVIKNNAGNTFSAAYTLTVSPFYNAVTLTSGDFDWDGNPDIAYHTGGYDVFVLNGDGLFNFSSNVLFHRSSAYYSTKLHTFDFNNDGKSDIMFREGVDIYKGIGNNNFTLMTHIGEVKNEAGYDMRNVLFNDINNDGYKDIIFSSSADDVLKVSFGGPSYLYQTNVIYSTANTPCGMTANDFNNDGFCDVITGTYYPSPDGYNLLFGNANGLSGYTPMNINPALSSTAAFEVSSADFNGDGYSDLLTTGDSIRIYLNTTSGSYNLTYKTLSSASCSVEIADLNNDGFLDILYGRPSTVDYLLIYGNGNGTFQAPQVIYHGAMTCTKIKAADFDNDGFKDIVFNFQQNGLVIYKNNVGISFSPVTTPALNGGSGVQNFGIGDFNSDGLNDIAFGHTSFGASVISLLSNNTGLSFSVVSSSISVCNGGSTNALVVGDYDLDGKDDIVITHSSCYGVTKHTSVFKQTASNSFSLTGMYTLTSEAQYLFMKDVNMDSFPDIVFSEANSGVLDVYLNDKIGGFYKESLNTLGRVVNSCYGDFNNDGKTDIATIGGLSIDYILIQLNSSMKISPVGNQTICTGSSIVIKKNGAYPGFSWIPVNSVADSIIVISSGTYSAISNGGINGCTSTASVNVIVNQTCQDVWPGDANSDGTADNFDVLELGLHFTQTGPSRATTGNAWQSYFSNNWTGTITNGKNFNHSDCNGDGTINNNDTLAIYTNYGLTHAFKQPEQTVTNPQLSIVPDQTAVNKGTWGTASVFLGEASAPVTNINGLAFTVTFDQTVIDANNFYVEYPTSFLNTSNQNLKFNKPDFVNGKLYTATTHTISGNVSGNGKIAILHYKIKSTLATDEILNVSIMQAKQSNAAGTLTPLTAGTATIAAIGTNVGIDELNGNSIGIFPNPASTSVTIHSSTPLEKIELLSITGQVILSEKASGNQHQLNLADVANGVYFVVVYDTNQKITRKKIVVQH